MKYKLLTKTCMLILAVFITAQVNGNVLQQHFDEDTPSWVGTTESTAPDGWKYKNFAYAQSAEAYYDNFGGRMNPNGTQSYIVSPEKSGGVGWVTFFYKPIYSAWEDNFNLVVQTSTNGLEFTDKGSIPINLKIEAGYNQASVIVNESSAKYVRLFISTTSWGSVFVDEITITDAVSDGTPATVSINNIPTGLVCEVGSSIPANGATLTATNLTGDVSLSFGSESAFESTTPSLSPIGGSLTDVAVNATFAPTQGYINAGFLMVSGGGLPEILYRFEGTGVACTVQENFNVYQEGSSNFTYNGWQIVGEGSLERYSNIFEGAGSIKISGSLISPEKAGGVGDISFYYRSQADNRLANFTVSYSPDKAMWFPVNDGSVSAAPAEWLHFQATVNEPTAKYVKITASGGDGKNPAILMLDAYEITANNEALPIVTTAGGAFIGDVTTAPYTVNIPLNFSNISSDVTIAFADNQLTSTVTTIPVASATGAYSLPVTYTPADNSRFINSKLNISGGGLSFPVSIPVQIYILQENLYTDFETNWTNSDVIKDQITADGWTILKGKRDNYETAFNSAGSAYLEIGGALIAPPVKSGIGDVQFYARISASSNFTLSTSTDGKTWTPVTVTQPEIVVGNWAPYQFTVENQTAKYLKIEYGSTIHLDEVKVAPYGQRIANIKLDNFTTFEITTAQAKTIHLKGAGFSSDVNVRFAKGNVFSINGSSTIAPADINNKTYELSIQFTPPVSGSYALDTLFVESADLARKQAFVIDGYILRDLVHEDFNTNWVQTTSFSNFTVNGWIVANGSAQTYAGNDLYEGAASVSLSGGGKLLSVPKSGGVGTIAFYYHSGWNSVSLKIVSYPELGGTATPVQEINVPASQPFTYIEIPVNDPNVKYIEFQNTTEWNTIYLDLVTITPNGMAIPKVTAPANVIVSAYKNENGSETFSLTLENISGEVSFSLKDENQAFSIDKQSVTPAGANETVELTLNFSPTGKNVVNDVLLIEGSGLITSVSVPLIGTVYKDVLVQDFESAEWNLTAAGNTVLDGWDIYNGKGKASWDNALQGNNHLELSVNNSKAGYVISPAKSGGVNNLKFYYKSNVDNLKVAIATSADRNTWTPVDTITNVSIPWNADYKYRAYEKAVADRAAKYVRVQPVLTENTWESLFIVDSIAIDALSYLRQVNTVDTLKTATIPASIEVQIAGLLNSAGVVSLNGDDGFSTETASINAEELTNDGVATISVNFTASQFGEFKTILTVTSDDVELQIPLVVKYTQPTGFVTPVVNVKTYFSGDVLHIMGAQGGEAISVTNANGQSLYQAKVKSSNETITLPLAKGVYLVKVGGLVCKLLK